MDENEIEGTFKDVKGKVKDAAGGLTGDVGLQADGKLDQLSGKVQKEFGGAMDDAASAIDGVKATAADYANRTAEALRGTAQTVRDAAGGTAESLSGLGVKAGEYVDRVVKERPFLAVLGLAAASYALAFFVHSPSSPLTPPPPKNRYLR